MPDFIIPLDTVGNSVYLNRLFTSNAIREFSMTFANRNKEELLKKGYDDFFNNFEVTESILKELIAVAEESDLPFDKTDFDHSKSLIKIHLKAQIARGLWNNDGFYPIFNQTNEIYMQAKGLFAEAETLTVGG